MLALARRYGLALDNTFHQPPNTTEAFWFNGSYYSQAQLDKDWHKFGWKLFNDAVKAAPFPTLHSHYTQVAFQWDQMSVADWIKANVSGGVHSPFGALCYWDVLSEYGGPPERQSALNLIYVLGYDDSNGGNDHQPKNSPVLAGTNEKYHVRGGNDQIIAKMVAKLPGGSIETGHNSSR